MTFFGIYQSAVICLTAFLFLDMILTFKDPFYPSNRRLRYYLIGTTAIVIFQQIYAWGMLLSNNDFFEVYLEPFISRKFDKTQINISLQLEDSRKRVDKKFYYLVLLIGFLVVAATSISFAEL